MSLTMLLRRDVRVEWRGKQAVLAAAVLFALFVVLDLFTFPALTDTRAATAAIWAPIVFGAAALCGRSLAADADTRTLDLLRAAPVSLLAMGASRTVVQCTVLAGLSAVSLAAAAWLFAAPVTATVAGIVGLGAFGIAVVGTLAGGIGAQARNREALLPVLLAPALAPLLQAVLSATVLALGGASWPDLRVHLLVAAGYDVAACGVAWLLWPVVLEAE